MNIDEVKALTDLMVANDLAEVMIRDGEKRIIIRRGIASLRTNPAVMAAPPPVSAHAPAALPPLTATPAVDPNLATIKSPMVGTFYLTPSPDAPAFVKLGDRVNPESVVCIIEAMKVFNEIKAEVAGIIESIEVGSGAPVEFGQILMKVRTA
jgi:acetyl-CoA carboxylase biotin carboxyl carrier protein